MVDLFDYLEEQHTKLMWIFEGLTSYFDDRIAAELRLWDAIAKGPARVISGLRMTYHSLQFSGDSRLLLIASGLSARLVEVVDELPIERRRVLACGESVRTLLAPGEEAAWLEQAGPRPSIMAGHSLGEYCALNAAGVISKEDTARLVFNRGELMHRDATRHQGVMHAIVGLSIDEVSDMVSEGQKGGVVSVANHNTELQIVITGAEKAVTQVSALATAKGAKSIPLKVSGAWHSTLIKDAQDEFKEYLETISFNSPQKSIFLNVTADLSDNADEIKEIMGRQLCSSVRWYDAMNKMIEEDVEVFVEVGPGRVLAGLLKKILRPANIN